MPTHSKILKKILMFKKIIRSLEIPYPELTTINILFHAYI